MSYRTGLAVLAAAIWSLGAPVADAADVVILESTTEYLPAGSTIPEEMSINLPAQETVLIIMTSGETREVVGPYSGPIGEAETSLAGADGLSAGRRNGDTKVLGAHRAPKFGGSE